MNDELISRDAVLDACSQSINILDAMSRIEDLPSVPPKQRVGRWIDEGYYADGCNASAYRCSVCGEHIIEYEPDRYCKFCGAKMEEQE